MNDDYKVLAEMACIILAAIVFAVIVRTNGRVRRFFQKPFFKNPVLIRPEDSLAMKMLKGFLVFCVLGHIVCSLLKLFGIWP